MSRSMLVLMPEQRFKYAGTKAVDQHVKGL